MPNLQCTAIQWQQLQHTHTHTPPPCVPLNQHLVDSAPLLPVSRCCKAAAAKLSQLTHCPQPSPSCPVYVCLSLIYLNHCVSGASTSSHLLCQQQQQSSVWLALSFSFWCVCVSVWHWLLNLSSFTAPDTAADATGRLVVSMMMMLELVLVELVLVVVVVCALTSAHPFATATRTN